MTRYCAAVGFGYRLVYAAVGLWYRFWHGRFACTHAGPAVALPGGVRRRPGWFGSAPGCHVPGVLACVAAGQAGARRAFRCVSARTALRSRLGSAQGAHPAAAHARARVRVSPAAGRVLQPAPFTARRWDGRGLAHMQVYAI